MALILHIHSLVHSTKKVYKKGVTFFYKAILLTINVTNLKVDLTFILGIVPVGDWIFCEECLYRPGVLDQLVRLGRIP